MMLCDLAVRVGQNGGLILRVSGKTASGPSGTGGRDSKVYTTAEALLRDLIAFGLGPEVASAAAGAMRDPKSRERFINFADNEQISFDVLEKADIYLFD